ncbi:MAG TPA: nucleoside diphosphate kinase regulator [Sphingomicrobium sp.]|nr:nucleoside diphosphate kinase regulator [Sphingomicrobium sp.]
MVTAASGADRPPIHLLAAESDLVANLALKAEHGHPVVAAMLLEEIERAELHEPATMPDGHVRLNSKVAFVDENTNQLREVRLVLPGDANIAEGRVSILTPMGAALYGLSEGHTIEWPDRQGHRRPIRIVRVMPPEEDAPTP